jgi:hypothetical protein
MVFVVSPQALPVEEGLLREHLSYFLQHLLHTIYAPNRHQVPIGLT